MLDEAACRAIDETFREVAGLLGPANIRVEREKLALSQKVLATYLDGGESTLSRWETGAQLQQRAMDKLLRGFFGCPQFRAFLGSTKRTAQHPTRTTRDEPQ